MRVLALLSLCLAFTAAAAAQVPANGAVVADGVQQALTPLQAAVTALDPDTLHLGGDQKQALEESRTSLERNLSDAVPGLLAEFRKAPENMGAAFRLYRDLDAVLSVAQHAVEVIPAGKNGEEPGAALASATNGLRDSLGKLGDWIETRGAADYASLQKFRTQAAAAPQTPPPPPKTLIINDANAPGTSKKSPKKAK
jgi:hypothetical protein